VAPARHLVELRVDDPSVYTVGQEIRIADLFEPGTKADVSGISKGKGFAGVMERHNFSGQGGSHGNHKKHRAPGSIGACATPARVFKGMRMAGRLGGERVTTLNIDIIGVDGERDILLLGGAVPGPKGAVVLVREAVKARG
jgi:large subunit ribosomal protein L3